MIDESLLEPLAMAVHSAYLTEEQDSDVPGQLQGSPAATRSWSELNDDLREANRAFVRDIPHKLTLIGATVVPADEAAEPAVLTDEEIDRFLPKSLQAPASEARPEARAERSANAVSGR